MGLQIPQGPYNTIQTRKMIENRSYLSDTSERNAVAENWISSKAAKFRENVNGHSEEIKEYCNEHCGGFEDCVGPRECPFWTIEEVNTLLPD